MPKHAALAAASTLALLGSARADTATLAFELEMFDLDAGEVHTGCFYHVCLDADFEFAYNADTANPVRLFQNQMTADVAFLDGIPFDAAGCDDLEAVAFTDQLVGEPFDEDDTMLIRTAEDRTYKVGFAVANGDVSVTFAYALLACGDCPWDVNGDGEVNELDLVAVVLEFGLAGTTADVTGDGTVDVQDVIDVILNWGSCGAD